MPEALTPVLVAPVPPVDAASWHAALGRVRATLADLAVRRGAAGPFRITDHEVRGALDDGERYGGTDPFTWSARTARRPLGLAAVRRLADGAARSPAEAVHARLQESADWVRAGAPCASDLDRWVARLGPAGRTAVAAEAVTWATRLWCALDWAALGRAPVVGRDRWWDSPHSALLALRGRADVRVGPSALVVLSGPRRESVRAELALVTLVEALRTRGAGPPGRVVGWWPDSGHVVRLDPEPAVLTLAADAVATVLAGSAPAVRPAA